MKTYKCVYGYNSAEMIPFEIEINVVKVDDDTFNLKMRYISSSFTSEYVEYDVLREDVTNDGDEVFLTCELIAEYMAFKYFDNYEKIAGMFL